MKMFKRYLKYRRFIRKIRNQLPIRHPKTGTWLAWDICLIRVGSKYNSMTGREIGGHLILSIKQHNPGIILADNRVYKYNWKKKRIETVGATWR